MNCLSFSTGNGEFRSAFGNGDVYIEKYVTSLRHIEVQLLRDTQGSTSSGNKRLQRPER